MSVTGVSRSSSPGDLNHVIAAISAGLAQPDRTQDLPAIFERELQRSLSIRSVRLREIPARYRARLVTPTRTADSIVLGVPTGDPRVQAVLEASQRPGTHSRVSGPRGAGGCRAARRSGARTGAQPSTTACLRRWGGTADRIERGDAAPAGAGRTRRAHRVHGADRRRKRHRKGAGRAPAPRARVRAPPVRSSPSTAPRSSKHCSRPSCSASRIGQRPASRAAAASSSLPTRARSSSTKSRTCRCRRRPSCCARSRRSPSSASAVPGVAARRHTHHRRHQPAARRSGRAGPVPSRPVLPPRRGGNSRAGPARAARGHLRAGATTSSAAIARRETCSLSAPAVEALRAYDWPGNVRELERLIESAVALTESDVIELDDLPPRVRGEYAEVLGHSTRGRRTRCARGAAAMRDWCSSAVAGTSVAPAGCSTSATTRCRRTLRYAETTASGSDKQLPAWVKSASQEQILEEARVR